MSTRQDTRKVLFVVHTVASANRLLDLVPLFDSDLRVELLFTCPEVSVVSDGVAETFEALGVRAISWPEALERKFDLAVTANHRGELRRLAAQLMIVSHGVGYTKKSARKSEIGNRKSEIGLSASAYGLSRDWLLHEDEVIPDALVLTHAEQHTRLAREVPEALPTATVAGDPCLDRLRASTFLRDRYRRHLGVGPDQRLLVISSTWNGSSVFGSWPALFRQVMAELDESWLVAGIVHPHVWHGHGTHQLRLWLADCLRSGLLLVPPLEGWGAALVAADLVVGDHGAVTTYGAALGHPVALAAFPDHEVVPGTCVDVLGRTAPRLDPRRPLRPQLESVLATPPDLRAVADLVASHPDEAAARHRTLAYGLLGLPEPDSPALVPVLSPDFQPLTATTRAWLHTPHGRYGADVQRGRSLDAPALADPILVAHVRHPDRTTRLTAEVLLGDRDELSFDALPSCLVFVHGNEIRHQDGREWTVAGDPVAAAVALVRDGISPAAGPA
ncbi:hypothetical protein JOF53_004762 [Crossiella equi]|uniref:Uncharacterized protein n=1 Tax=Crossiella equi TaxID=130796 RepID=A0ABS5AH36_9PSEU|nr:hypothetical protein [Crossiella equi]MBP2475890.1 hypothetical protein [Crossiella equi]